MKIMSLINILWFGQKYIDKYEDIIYSFSVKYASSPIAGYAIFGILLVLAVAFIKAFSNK